MRVLIVCCYVRGGVGSHVSALATELRRRGDDVSVLAANQDENPADYPWVTRWATLSEPSLLSVPDLPHLRSIVRDQFWSLSLLDEMSDMGSFDVIHAHDTCALTPVTYFAKHNSIPVVLTKHGIVGSARDIDIQGPGEAAAWQRHVIDIESWNYEAVDELISVSSSVSAIARSNGYNGPESVIHNGNPLAAARSGPPALTSSSIQAVFVGRLTVTKRADHAIQALLMSGAKNARLLIVGDGPLRGDLEGLVQKEALGDRVSFLGEVAHNEMAEIYSHADILICTSAWESDSIVTREARSAGVLVVCYDAGGIGEQICDGQDGMLVQTGDRESLAAVIRRVCDDPGHYRAIARAGQLRQAGSATWEDVAAQTRTVYDAAIAARARE